MSESTEPSPTTAQDPTNNEGSARERLAAMLQDERPETAAEGEAGESQVDAKPKELKDLAERHSYSDDDLYAIEVPMADGKKMSIGKLKDAAAKQDDFLVRELAFEERVAKQEAEWTRAQTEMQELMSHLDPKAIKPELREKVRQKIEADVARERKRVLEVIPEWSNETVRDAELGLMVEDLKDFGIHESFLTATMNHKLFRYVRRNALREQKWRQAVAKVVEVRKPSTTGKAAAGNGAAKPLATKPQANARVTARDRLQKALNS